MSKLSGTVRISAHDGFTTHFLCSRLGKLKAQYPSLTIQLVPMSRTFSLSKREADLAITIERPEEGRLAARKLIDYSLHFYAAKNYLAERVTPQNIADLERHYMVTYVQDLISADQLNFMPEPYGLNYRRLECSSAVGRFVAKQASGFCMTLSLIAILDYKSYCRASSLSADTGSSHTSLRRLRRVCAISDFISAEVGAQRSIFRQ